jgi:glucan phosphoethanolaminetransferase (alkaline phosphatase superfamily)
MFSTSLLVYFLASYALVTCVMIVERRFGWYSLRRSRELIKGAWWRTLGIVITAALIAHIPAVTLGFFWKFIPLVGSVFASATHALSTTYAMIVAVVYYFDRRCRTEDFDLRLLAQQVRADATSTMIPGPQLSSLA